MTVRNLIDLLSQYPDDMGVMMEVNGVKAAPTDVDWEAGGQAPWLTITDYPVEYRKKFPEGEDSSEVSDSLCARCTHHRGLHEIRVETLPFGYCIHVECDCTEYVDNE